VKLDTRHAAWAAATVLLIALPFIHRDPYHLHILILISDLVVRLYVVVR